jgi:hypothetical protein
MRERYGERERERDIVGEGLNSIIKMAKYLEYQNRNTHEEASSTPKDVPEFHYGL